MSLRDDGTFVRLAESFFNDRIGPRLLEELRAGRHHAAKKILTDREARELERRLRQAPRETAP